MKVRTSSELAVLQESSDFRTHIVRRVAATSLIPRTHLSSLPYEGTQTLNSYKYFIDLSSLAEKFHG